MSAVHPIRGVLFDKDGTLIDYKASWGPINLRVADMAAGGDPALAAHLLRSGGADPETGYAVADSVLAAGNTVEIAQCWVEHGAVFGEADLIEALDTVFSNSTEAAVPVTDLPLLLGRLKGQGLVLGIASSDSALSIRRLVAHLGLDDMIDFVAGYDSGFGHKPQPGMIEAFCRATGLAPGEIAMVGDNTHDLAMGRAAGVGLTVGVLTGTGSVESLTPLADACLASIELLGGVLGLEGVAAG